MLLQPLRQALSNATELASCLERFSEALGEVGSIVRAIIDISLMNEDDRLYYCISFIFKTFYVKMHI